MADTNAMFSVGVAWLNSIMGAKVRLNRLGQETIEQYTIKDTVVSQTECQELSDHDGKSNQHMLYEYIDNDDASPIAPALKAPLKRKYCSEKSKLASVEMRSYGEDDYTKLFSKGRIKKYKSTFAKAQDHELHKHNMPQMPETTVRYARTAASVKLSSSVPKFRKFRSISARARAELLKLEKSPHVESSAVVDTCRQIDTLRSDKVLDSIAGTSTDSGTPKAVMLTSTPLTNNKRVVLSSSIYETPIRVSNTPKFNFTLAGIMKGNSLNSGAGPIEQNDLAKILQAVKQQTPGKIIDLSHSFGSEAGKYSAGVSSKKTQSKVINLRLDSALDDPHSSNIPVSGTVITYPDHKMINGALPKVRSSTSRSHLQTIVAKSAKELFKDTETIDKVNLYLEQPVSPLLGTCDRTKSLSVCSIESSAATPQQNRLANSEVSVVYVQSVHQSPYATPQNIPNVSSHITSMSTCDTDVREDIEKQLSASSSRISARVKKKPVYMAKHFDVHLRRPYKKANRLSSVSCTETKPQQSTSPDSQVSIPQSEVSTSCSDGYTHSCATPENSTNVDQDSHFVQNNASDVILTPVQKPFLASTGTTCISRRLKKTPIFISKHFDLHRRRPYKKANRLSSATSTETKPQQSTSPDSQVLIPQSEVSSSCSDGYSLNCATPENSTDVDQNTNFMQNNASDVILAHVQKSFLASTGRISTRMKKTPIYMSENFDVHIPVVRSLKEIQTSKAVCAEFSVPHTCHSSENSVRLFCSNNNLESEHDEFSQPIHNHLSNLMDENVLSGSAVKDNNDDYKDDSCSENEPDTYTGTGRYQYMASLGLESSLSDTEFLSPSKSILHKESTIKDDIDLRGTPFHKPLVSSMLNSAERTRSDAPANDYTPSCDVKLTCDIGSHGHLNDTECSSNQQLTLDHQSHHLSDNIDAALLSTCTSPKISKNSSPNKFISVLFNHTPVKQERINTVLDQILRPSVIVCRLEDHVSCQKSGCPVWDSGKNESVDKPIQCNSESDTILSEDKQTIVNVCEDKQTVENVCEDKPIHVHADEANDKSTIQKVSKPLKKGMIKRKHRRVKKKIEAALSNLPGEYKCAQCDMVYSFQVSIRNHMMKKHVRWWTAEKPAGNNNIQALQKILKVLGKLTCPKCGKVMFAAANFGRHMTWCGHENDQFICTQCNKPVRCMYRWQHEQKHLAVEEVSCRGRRPAAEKALVKVRGMAQILLGTNSKDSEKHKRDDDDDSYSPDNVDHEDDEDDELNYKIRPLRSKPVVSNFTAMANMLQSQWQYSLEQEHLGNMLFPELLPSHDIWSSDKALKRDEFEVYLPSLKESMAFCQAHQYKQKFTDVSQSTRLGLFQAVTVNDTAMFFTGGPVWALDWCPVSHQLTNTPQHLATASYHQPDMMTKGNTAFTGPGLIQIWKCATLQCETEAPSFSLGMAHSWGCIYDMRWCPMGSWQVTKAQSQLSLSRLGVLALACSDGSVRVLSVPQPASLGYTGTEPLIYHASPIITLRPVAEPEQDFGICMCVDWSPHDRCSLIAAGFANGCVFLWDMNTKSKLLRVSAVASTSDRPCSEEILYPCRSIMAHAGLVRGVSWNPIINNVLGTCAERAVKLWRTNANVECLLSEKTGKLTGLTHIPVWNSLLSVNDDCYHIHVAGPTLTEPRSSSLPSHLVYHNTAVWDSTYSNWLHLILSCDHSGLVHGNKLLRNTNNIKKANHRKFVLGETFVWPLDKAIPSFEMDKENHKLSQLTVKGNPKDISSNFKNARNRASLCVKRKAMFGRKRSNKSKTSGNTENVEQLKTWSSLPTNYSELAEKYCMVFINHDLDSEPSDVRLRQRHGALFPHDETRSAYPITALYRISVCPHPAHCSWVAFGGQSGIVRLRKLGAYTCREPEAFIDKLYRNLHKNWDLEIPGDPD